MPSAAPTAWSSAVSVAYRPSTEASPSSAAAATSRSRTSSQTIALGVRAAFGDTRLRDGRRVLVRRAHDFIEPGRPPSGGSLLPNECGGTL